MSRKHLDRVKLLPCLLAGPECRAPMDPHHLKRAAKAGVKGMGMTHKDRYAVPLCRAHHREAEAGDDDAYFAALGFDARGIADALWSERGNLDAMRGVVDKARALARLKARTT